MKLHTTAAPRYVASHQALAETLRSQVKALRCPQYCKTPVCLVFLTAKTSFTPAMAETSFFVYISQIISALMRAGKQ